MFKVSSQPQRDQALLLAKRSLPYYLNTSLYVNTFRDEPAIINFE